MGMGQDRTGQDRTGKLLQICVAWSNNIRPTDTNISGLASTGLGFKSWFYGRASGEAGHDDSLFWYSFLYVSNVGNDIREANV